MDDMNDKIAFLTNSIMKSKDVMRAVETKQYKTGNIDPLKLVEDTQTQSAQPYLGTAPKQMPQYNPNNLNKSKMPIEIIESFRQNPPIVAQSPQIGLSFLDEATSSLTSKPVVNETTHSHHAQPIQQPIMSGMNELQLEGLKSIMEKLVRETMEKVLNEREKLNESTATNETIQIKIGNSIFSGKITGVRDVKK